MFFYLIHNLPWGSELNAGKRNVRTLLIGSVCYVFFHALLYAHDLNFSPIISTILNISRYYFWWILLIDAIAMSVLYKLAYGRTIFSEIPLPEMIKDWVGDDPHPPTNFTIVTKTEPIIPSTNPTPTTNELDFDLLTENEEPISKIVENIETIPSQETSDKSDELDENENESEIEMEHFDTDSYETETETETIRSQSTNNSPKLTPENIDKYITQKPVNTTQPKSTENKPNPEPELESKDLDLN